MVREDTKYGRVLVCSRNFQVNDIILTEEPILVYSDLLDLLLLYVRLENDATRDSLSHLQSYQSVTDANYPLFAEKLAAIEDIAKEAMVRVAKFAPSSRFQVTVTDLFRILTASIINCHGFPGYKVTCPDTGRIVEKDSALFAIASKAAHSCVPNCVYTNFRPQGTLTYFAHRPMTKGDVISFCYVDYMCTRARRDRLMSSKDFFCRCPKCEAPDFSYGVRCQVPACGGTTLPTCLETDFSMASWCCATCGCREAPVHVQDDLEEAESRFEAVKGSYTADGERFYSQGPLPMLEELIAEIAESFCPTHYLVTEALLEQAELLLQGVDSLEGRMPGPAVNDLRIRAAQSLFAAVQTMECVENSCLVGSQCSNAHLATHHGVGHVLRACLELLKCRTADPVLRFPKAAEKYLYLLEGVYGPDDNDIVAIKHALSSNT